ncbi:MAG: GH3 auxin-responsive promoter family protein, partial [Bacteroidia bacterium]
MALKSFISLYYARLVVSNIKKWSRKPIETQQAVLKDLIQSAQNTSFGKDHFFSEINSYEDFKKRVPIRDYEALSPYINRIINGESDVLWKGVPIYFCKTSGTTSGTKYIPISKESISNHIDSARNALLCYIAETCNTQFVDGKMIFLQGSPKLDKKGKIATGRLSGIVAHHIPSYLQKNRMPSYATNCIEDWEEKVEAIAKETMVEDMRLISGIPPWVQMYFEKLLELSGNKNIKQLFPHFSLFVYGGVNYEPYRKRIEQLIGAKVDSIETYPASEGFIAFQNSQKEEGLLLILNKGIFYEFIPAEEYFNENPTRISLKDVELGKNYALIMNT